MKTIFVILLSAFTILTSDDVTISFDYKDNDYPITDEMIKNAYTINNPGDHRNDIIYWRSTAIFKDDKSQEVIFIDLGTNWARSEISHFYVKEIPDELVKKYSDFLEINNKLNNIDVTKKIKDSIKNATIIDKKYFTTKKKFRLDMNIKKAISIYGKPTKKIENNDTTKLIWDYYSSVYGKLHRGAKIGENISEELFNKVAYGFILKITFINDKANFIYMRNMEP